MIAQCPVLSLVGDTSISGSLLAMDCHVEQAVEIGYDRLFGAGGAFVEVLTAALTVYIALLAYGFLTGRTRLTVAMMSPRLTTMVLVLTFVTFWPAYHTLFYTLFMDGPDQIAAAVLAQKGSAMATFAQHLDRLFVAFSEIEKAFAAQSASAAGAAGSASTAGAASTAGLLSAHVVPVLLFSLSGMILLLSTLGMLILTRLTLYLLLVLGPVFILLALFDQTRGLFNGWLKSVFVFAMAPMLTILGGNAALAMFAPLVASIGEDPQRAAEALQPILVLFMGAVIYAAFLAVLMRLAAALARDWQAAGRDPLRPVSPRTEIAFAPPTVAAQQAATGSRRPAVGDILVSSGPPAAAASGASSARSLDLASGSAAQGVRLSRVRGLGQRFRAPAVRTPFIDKRRP